MERNQVSLPQIFRKYLQHWGKKNQLLHWSPILFPILGSPESSDAALKHSPKGNKKDLDLLEFHSDSPGKCDHKIQELPILEKQTKCLNKLILSEFEENSCFFNEFAAMNHWLYGG